MADSTSWLRNFSVFLIGYFTFTCIGIRADKVMLLDTTTELQKLNWTTKVVQPTDSSNNGWNEVSSYVKEITLEYPLRVYHSCYVSSTGVNNWLRTPFIDVGEANSVYVEMIFNMRKCVKHQDPSILQQCQQTFSLYYYGADRDFANSEMPSWDSTTYRLVDKIPAQYLSEAEGAVILNTVTKFVSLQPGLRGVYFAFQDTGSCIALMAIKVYSKVCVNVTKSLAFFSETPTGRNLTSTVETEGTCVPNSSENGSPKYRCMSDGTWDILLGKCMCHKGFEGYEDEQCLPCKPGYFKWDVDDYICSKCPDHSHTEREQSVECQCVSSYYRADKDPKHMPCTRPPSKPRDLRTISVTDKKVRLTWLPPADSGGRIDVTYRIECHDCGSYVMVSPKLSGFNTTSAELSGLRPRYKYTLKVYAENGVSHMSTRPIAYDMVDFTTDSSLAEILNVITEIGETSITLTWQVVEDRTVNVVRFEVVHYVQGNTMKVSNLTTSNTITFSNLKRNTDYYFQVRGETDVAGWGEYSEPIKVTTGTQYETKNELEPGPSVIIIVGSIVAVVLCMAIAAVMIFILVKRNRRNDGKNSDIDGPYHHVTVPLFQPTGTIKSYVDPHTYEDPNQAVREFTREIDASHITIESVIGGGEFGDVCKGKLRVPNRPEMSVAIKTLKPGNICYILADGSLKQAESEFGDVCKGKLRVPNRPEMSVAIKTLKPGATDKNRLDFLTEASIMGQFDDPNVIFLEGVVTKSNPIMIVTEYMSNGSLDGFLRKNDGQLTVIQLVGMMRGIASGMRYLSEMGYVHRDLAARNILCNESLVCKVADFGLSREVDIDTTDGAYTTKGGKIPVRWTAPEAIAFRKFTSASDVWSFGVVMWEVISYGERPYWNWSNQDVIKAVEKGYRLPPPMECPEAIHQLMLDTWQKERNNRPKFQQIVKTLDKLIRAPELLRKMAKPRPHVFIDNSPPDVTNFASVEEWLNVIKMDRYRDNFVNAGILNMDQVMRITVKDLDTLGITLLGHQKKIMNSVQTLRAQLLGPTVHLPNMQMSEGFLV